MKTLYILRHAKAEDGLNKKDFDRELTLQGLSDIQKIAHRLVVMDEIPQLIISSPAKRAINTAKEVAEIAKYPINDIIIDPKLYDAGNYLDILEIIKSIDNKYDSVMLIGHNPTLKQIADYLFEKNIEWLPKSGAIGLQFEENNWKNIVDNSGKILFFTHPKEFIYFDLKQLKNFPNDGEKN